jgi:hypothetical protein
MHEGAVHHLSALLASCMNVDCAMHTLHSTSQREVFSGSQFDFTCMDQVAALYRIFGNDYYQHSRMHLW